MNYINSQMSKTVTFESSHDLWELFVNNGFMSSKTIRSLHQLDYTVQANEQQQIENKNNNNNDNDNNRHFSCHFYSNKYTFNGSMMNLTVLQLCSLLFVHFYIFKCVYIQYFHLNFAQMFIEVSKTNLKVFLFFCSSLLKSHSKIMASKVTRKIFFI